MNDHYAKVVEYFNEKADDYDQVDEQLYWVLSDTFYKNLLAKKLQTFIDNKREIKLLDAGAGTGRWSLILNEIIGSRAALSGKLIDISPNMLEIARRKFEKKGLLDNFTFQVGNIENLSEVADSEYDLSISFYNVLSFVENPSAAVEEIGRKLKKGGIHISVVGNTYHALYFSILTGREKELKRVLEESKIAFNDLMPPMHCFTPDELTALYKKSGFSNVAVRGGPNFIYPGMEETFLRGQNENLKQVLSNSGIFNQILEAEERYADKDDIVGRGNTLIVFAKK